MKDEIQDMEMESSTVSADETEAQAPQEPQREESADSSSATDDSGEVDLLSVVRDAVRPEQTEEEPDAASSAEGEEDGEQTGEAEVEQDDENYSDVPFNKHPRFRKLLAERNSFKADAERYQNIQGFLDNSGLDNQEAADGMVIMALAKTNPAEAWNRIKPWVQKLLVASGEVLPDDLTQRVKQGEITRDAALELSRMRAGQSSTQAQRELEARQRQQLETRNLQNGIVQTVSEWETQRRQRDPNFNTKMDSLQREVAYIQSQEGKPQTIADVRKQLDRAYKAVNERLAAPAPAAPAKKAINPIRGGQVAGGAQPKPESTLDIVRAARRSA